MSRQPPGVSPVVFARALNGGLRIRPLTDAQRLSLTPPLGDIIMTSDTNLYYVGDGVTVGGVASATGLTLAQARRLNIIEPRAHDFLASLRAASGAGFPGLGVGNSIVQGTGATSASLNWLYLLANKLQVETLVGVTNEWQLSNTGVGGSQILVPLAYVSDLLTSGGIISAGVNRRGRRKLGALMTMRNDVATSLGLWNQRCRTLIRGMLQGVEDIIVVAEPPQITYATGAVLDSTQWCGITKIMREVCADYGVTYVDVWQKWILEAQAGADLRTRMSDGTHPNDIGHRMIADLVMQALLAPTTQAYVPTRDRASDGIAAMAMPIAAYTPVTASVGTTTVSGLTTSTTARKRELTEGSTVAYSLANTQTIRFDVPLPMYRLRPTVVQGNLSTGSLTVDGVALTSLASSAGSTLELPNNPTMPAVAAPGVVLITCTHATNPLRILGLQVDVPEALDQHPTWTGGTESGTWGDATFAATGVASGSAVRSSSTIGDYIDISWYGTYLTFAVETGTGRGKLTEVTDGGASTTHDGYAPTASYLYRCTPVQTVGWHTTRLTVAAKNVASSSNLLAVGFYKTCIPPDASLGYVAMGNAEVMALHGRWRTATIERVLSGSPYVSGWSPNSPTVTLGGSGTAIVRLQR